MATQDELSGNAAAGNPGPADPPPPGKPRRRSAWRWVFGTLLLIVLLLVVAVPVGIVLGLKSQPGSAWVLQQIPGLQVSGLRGSLLGNFEADKIELVFGGDGRLILEEPRWRGLSVSRSPLDGHWVAVDIDSLQARRARILPSTAPSPDEPLVAPPNLRLPLTLKIDKLALGEFSMPALGDKPVHDLQGRIELGADAGALHRIELQQVEWDQLRAGGTLQIGSDAPMEIKTSLRLQPSTAAKAASAATTAPLDDWSASIELTGPLAKPSLAASASAGSKRLLQAKAQLLPFEKWPLADLQASTQDLDLALFSSAAPKTALSGSAKIDSSGLDQPAAAVIKLDNAEAGRWDAGKLPLRSLRLDLQARPDAPQVATIRRFDAALGSAEQPAGRISGDGSFDNGKFAVNAVLEQLRPAALDARAPVMSLSGPFKVSGQLPTVAAVAAGAASAPTPPASDLTVAAKLELTGKLDNPTGTPTARKKGAKPTASQPSTGVAVKLAADVKARVGNKGSLQVEIDDLQAVAGKASARVDGKLQRADTAAPFEVKAKLTLQDFDPRLWLPGSNSEGWRKGASRIDAAGDVDLRFLPAAAPTQQATAGTRTATAPAADPVKQAMAALYEVLAQLRGRADLTLRPSVVAGVELDGAAAIKIDGASPGPGDASVDLALQSAGNRIKAKMRTRADRPTADRLELDIDAPALARLSAAAEMFGLQASKVGQSSTATPAAALAGAVNMQAEVNGRWPALQSQGKLAARELKVAGLALRRGDLNWKLGTRADAPIDLQAKLEGLIAAGASADQVVVKLDGTAANHRLVASADSSVLPPAWTDILTGAAPAGSPAAATAKATLESSPTQLSLRASGGLIDYVGVASSGSAPAASGWRGRIDQLRLRSGSSKDPAKALALRSDGLGLLARWAGAAPSLKMEPGRLELQAGPTIAALRWTQLEAQPAVAAANGKPASPARIDVEAEFEPLAIAPLLSRLQPGFGWGGDLKIGGRFVIHSAPNLRADIVVERRGGDLTVTDEAGVQPLGLSDLRLAVNGSDGVWNFTQAIAGTILGETAGAIVARTGSPNVWPDANTPIEGVIELRVKDLGSWGRWVPTGWRLGGKLHSSASFGGKIGAPEYTGELRGSDISVRNFVEGVNVSDGQIGVTLKGETATIETFKARAGDGSIDLSGTASFGAKPQAKLSLRADKFQLLGRVDRRIVVSGNGQMNLAAQKIAIDGNFKVDEGLIDVSRGEAPKLSDDVTVTRAKRDADGKIITTATRRGDEKPVEPAKPPPSAAARALALDLTVDLGSDLRLKGYGLDTGLRGKLAITSPGGKLTVNGTVSTVDGTFKAYGQKLKVERGSVIFIGPVDNPRLDIQATRPDIDDKVGVLVSGTTSNLRITLFSEPEKSEIDKLSLLVLGRATEGLGGAETALLQRAAFALLSGNGESTSDKVSRALGLDEISLRQTDGEVKQTVVSVGKQISSKVYLGYERGLNATAGSWQLIYRIAQRFTLRAQAGFENSLDLIWTWRWQ